MNIEFRAISETTDKIKISPWNRLDNCCDCDYIKVYDGPSVNSRLLGTVCNNSLDSFHSSSNYLTVLFRTDGSIVGRGFSADFTSTLPPTSGWRLHYLSSKLIRNDREQTSSVFCLRQVSSSALQIPWGSSFNRVTWTLWATLPTACIWTTQTADLQSAHIKSSSVSPSMLAATFEG